MIHSFDKKSSINKISKKSKEIKKIVEKKYKCKTRIDFIKIIF